MAFETPAWIEQHRRAWNTKPGLQAYYEKEYFSRICSMMPEGRSLEIGAGPGFFAEYRRSTVVTDLQPAPHIDICADVHALPFSDGSFSAVVGIDVLHHFQNPLQALRELGRVLAPSGRIILIEPWTTPLSRQFYRHVHHEDCFAIPDPLRNAFPPQKDAMDGNAEIPRTYLQELSGTLTEQSRLRSRHLELFGLFGYLATGGFTRLYFGKLVTEMFIAVDRITPRALRNLIALKAFIVLEKVG